MRVLVLSKYGRRAASPRHRFLAYEDYLAESGITLEFSPLLDDNYLGKVLEGRRAPKTQVAKSYLKRLLALVKAHRYDLLLIHCELFPYLPAWFEMALRAAGVPYVFDYDDAIFHMYDAHSSPIVRLLLGKKIGATISGASAVMAGSQYLARYAKRFNDNVFIVPTAVDLERYKVREPQPNASIFRIAWIGSPSTARHLGLVTDALEEFGRRNSAEFHVIGGKPPEIPNINICAHPWSEETEVPLLLNCDVGIMPLMDEPFARGKCAFKLIQYMACGLPTIASPVGANVEVVTPDVGILASSTEEWCAALEALVSDENRRRALGKAGREKCVAKYSLGSQKERLKTILQNATLPEAANVGRPDT